MRRPRFLLALGLMAVGLACAPFVTGVTAYAPATPSPLTRYTLRGPEPECPGGDPRWPRFAVMVTRALATRGFVRDEAAPQIVIEVSYGSGNGWIFERKERPLHGKGASRTIRQETASHYLRLEALDLATVRGGEPRVLWSTLGDMSNTQGDFADMLPYLLAAMEPHFAASAPVKVKIGKTPWDGEAERLKRP